MAKVIRREILDIRRDKQELNLPKRSVILGIRMGEDAGGFQLIYICDAEETKKEVRGFQIIKDNDPFDGYILYIGTLSYTNDSNVSFVLHAIEVD